MRKPNKIERMNAYLYAWAILTGCIKNPNPDQVSYFICLMVQYYHNETFDFDSRIVCGDELYENYPELYKQKPKKTGYVWWGENDKYSRITALENAIKLLA